jgi:glycine/D-amino acid oxidase-like deaminating enzyme
MAAPRVDSVLVVGDRLSAPLLQQEFREQGIEPRVLVLDTAVRGRELATIGNGEYYANARRVYGEPLADKLWEFSARNFARAQEILATLKIAARPVRQTWYAASEREAALQRETAGLLKSNAASPSDLGGFVGRLEEPALGWESPVSTGAIDSLLSVERSAELELSVTFRCAGKAATERAAVAVFASEEIPRAVLPWLGDKSIPVTLSSFVFPQAKPLPFARAIFNGGVDFVSAESGGLRVGSFRNLYEDKAVGRLTTADPATLAGVRKLFGSLGWIEAEVSPEAGLRYESLSCDGLPIVGALPDLPGAYVMTGFAARTSNFIFEAARRLARGIAHGGDFAGLQSFSTKRFV